MGECSSRQLFNVISFVSREKVDRFAVGTLMESICLDVYSRFYCAPQLFCIAWVANVLTQVLRHYSIYVSSLFTVFRTKGFLKKYFSQEIIFLYWEGRVVYIYYSIFTNMWKLWVAVLCGDSERMTPPANLTTASRWLLSPPVHHHYYKVWERCLL